MKMKKKVTILLKEMMEALASMAKAKSLSLSLQTRISALKLRLVVFSLLRDRRLQVHTNLHSLLNRRRNHQKQHKLEQQQQMRPIHDGDELQFDDDKRSDALVLFYYDGESCKSEPSVLCDGGQSEAGGSNLAETAANRVETETEEEANPVSDEWLEEAAVATFGEETLEEEDARKVLDELVSVVDGGDDGAANKVFDEMEFVVEGGGDDGAATDLAQKVSDEIESDVEEEGDDGGGGWVDLLGKSKEVEEEGFELEDKIDEVADLFIKRFHEQMRMERSPIHQ